MTQLQATSLGGNGLHISLENEDFQGKKLTTRRKARGLHCSASQVEQAARGLRRLPEPSPSLHPGPEAGKWVTGHPATQLWPGASAEPRWRWPLLGVMAVGTVAGLGGASWALAFVTTPWFSPVKGTLSWNLHIPFPTPSGVRSLIIFSSLSPKEGQAASASTHLLSRITGSEPEGTWETAQSNPCTGLTRNLRPREVTCPRSPRGQGRWRPGDWDMPQEGTVGQEHPSYGGIDGSGLAVKAATEDSGTHSNATPWGPGGPPGSPPPSPSRPSQRWLQPSVLTCQGDRGLPGPQPDRCFQLRTRVLPP